MRDLWASAPVEERGLLSHLQVRLDFRQRLSTPKLAKQVDRPWTEPRVVVIGKCQNHDAPLLDLLQKTDPLGKITLAINNHLVPSCRFFLDPFPVPQPPNVSEIGR